jgi:hypothetical protein
LGKWDVKRAKMHTVKKYQVTKLNILKKNILYSFDSTRLLNNKYFINCHNMISKSTVQETIDRIYVMLETPKKELADGENNFFLFSLTPTPSCITQTYRRKRL